MIAEQTIKYTFKYAFKKLVYLFVYASGAYKFTNVYGLNTCLFARNPAIKMFKKQTKSINNVNKADNYYNKFK